MMSVRLTRNRVLCVAFTLIAVFAANIVLAGVAQADPVCDVDPGAPFVFVPLPTDCDSDGASADYYVGEDTYIPPSPVMSSTEPLASDPLTSYSCKKGVVLTMKITDTSGVFMTAEGNAQCTGYTIKRVFGQIQIRRNGNVIRYTAFSAGAGAPSFSANAYAKTEEWRCTYATVANYRGVLSFSVETQTGAVRGPYNVRTQSFRGRCK